MIVEEDTAVGQRAHGHVEVEAGLGQDHQIPLGHLELLRHQALADGHHGEEAAGLVRLLGASQPSSLIAAGLQHAAKPGQGGGIGRQRLQRIGYLLITEVGVQPGGYHQACVLPFELGQQVEGGRQRLAVDGAIALGDAIPLLRAQKHALLRRLAGRPVHLGLSQFGFGPRGSGKGVALRLIEPLWQQVGRLQQDEVHFGVMALLEGMGAAQPLLFAELQPKLAVALHLLLTGGDTLAIQPAVVQGGLQQGVATDQGIGGTVWALAGQHVAAIDDGEGGDELAPLRLGEVVGLGEIALVEPLGILAAETVVPFLFGLRALLGECGDEGVVAPLVGQRCLGAEDEGAIARQPHVVLGPGVHVSVGADRKALFPANLLQLRHQFRLGLEGQVELVDPVAQIVLGQLEAALEGRGVLAVGEGRIVREEQRGRHGRVEPEEGGDGECHAGFAHDDVLLLWRAGARKPERRRTALRRTLRMETIRGSPRTTRAQI